MSLFQELEEVEEVKEEVSTTNSALLSDLISTCGIPEEQEVTTFPCSPANSMDSDMETRQSLIEELEDFFGRQISQLHLGGFGKRGGGLGVHPHRGSSQGGSLHYLCHRGWRECDHHCCTSLPGPF